MKQTVLSLTDMNEAVFAHFQRVTGKADKFQFPGWWAQREREVVRLQASEESSPEVAAARWARLSRAQQQARLLAYLEDLPPAPLDAKVTARRGVFRHAPEFV